MRRHYSLHTGDNESEDDVEAESSSPSDTEEADEEDQLPTSRQFNLSCSLNSTKPKFKPNAVRRSIPPSNDTSPQVGTKPVHDDNVITGSKSIAEQEEGLHLFSKLPIELRYKIWKQGCSVPRVVDLWPVALPYNSDGHFSRDWMEAYETLFGEQPIRFKSHCKIPSILHTCQEARKVGLEHYKLEFGTSSKITGPAKISLEVAGNIYFNHDCDTICVMTMEDEVHAQQDNSNGGLSQYSLSVKAAKYFNGRHQDNSIRNDVIAINIGELYGGPGTPPVSAILQHLDFHGLDEIILYWVPENITTYQNAPPSSFNNEIHRRRFDRRYPIDINLIPATDDEMRLEYPGALLDLKKCETWVSNAIEDFISLEGPAMLVKENWTIPQISLSILDAQGRAGKSWESIKNDSLNESTELDL